MNKFFMVNEKFDRIINTTLSDKLNICIIENLMPISTGWTNIVYKVETNKGNYFFRFPRDEFWERTIVKDCQFANFIKDKTSFEIADVHIGYDKGRPFSYHKEIPGKPLADVMDDLPQALVDKISSQICQFMNELHHIKFDKSKIFSVDNIGLNLNDFITELLDTHVSENDKSFWKFYNFAGENNCLIHGDFNSSNILLDDDNNVAAIIDFGFGGFGNKYMDISRIIGRCPQFFKNSIIKNYENIDNNLLDLSLLDNDIKIWDSIDSGYINYMRKIGIYKD